MPRTVHPALSLALELLLGGAMPMLLAWPVASGAAETAFVAGVEDLPLMPGLVEVEGAATVFDAPQGRIVETFAAGAVGADEVRAFYDQTLPQLGWTAAAAPAEGQVEYRREGERLVLEITPGATTTVVRFTLAPQ